MMPRSKCRLLIDSCSDLPYETVQSMDVDVLNFPFEMSDGTHIDDFWQSMTPEEFYTGMLNGEAPKTAQIPIPVLTETFERIAQSGEPTVYLAFTSGLSGTFDTVITVLEDVLSRYPEAEIYAVDTKIACVAEGFLVLEAVKQRDNGLTAKELADWAEEAKWYVHGIFTIDDLDILRRGGRIPPALASIGGKLDIKPILTFDLGGHLTVHSMVRGRKKSLKALNKIFKELLRDDSEMPMVVYGQAMAEKEMNALFEANSEFKKHIPVKCWCGPVIGAHVGPGFVAEVFWGPDRREKTGFGDKIAKSVRSDNKGEETE